MPWHWQGRGLNDDDRSTPREAAVAHAWPKYEAEYLRKRLVEGGGKYGDGPNGIASDVVQEMVYFDKISDDYKREADECLKKEFKDWLTGSHILTIYIRAFIRMRQRKLCVFTYIDIAQPTAR